MSRTLRSAFLGLLVFLLAASSGWAQTTAQINGTVADESGGVLPGATVTAVQTDTVSARLPSDSFTARIGLLPTCRTMPVCT